MIRTSIVFLMVILVNLYVFAVGGQSYVNQKKGVLQDKPGEHLTFTRFEKVTFDFDKVPIKNVKRVRVHKGLIYILDGKRNELYVLDKKGNHIHTIGRYGQGPEEIFYGSDFFISNDDRIYVLNSMPKRISVYGLNGKGIKTVRLSLPDGYYAFPSSLLVDKKGRFLVGSTINHLVSRYRPNGDYIDTPLRSNREVDFYRANVAGESCLGFVKNKIVVFDTFRGSFKLLEYSDDMGSKNGCATECSVHLPLLKKRVDELEKSSKREKYSAQAVSIERINIFNRCGVGVDGRIYSIPLSPTAKKVPIMFVFSQDGLYLYVQKLMQLKGHRVRSFDCGEDCIIFLTSDMDLYIGNFEKKEETIK
jgi:hypothetical protein